MTINQILADKSKKSKEKTENISKYLLEGSIKSDDFIALIKKMKDSDKATCIEAIEYASIQNSTFVDEILFSFVVNSLNEKAPRIKWECAKVIGNSAAHFPKNLDDAINYLLVNSEHKGTVVRWATAYALGEILKLKTHHNKDLLPTIEAICLREESSGVKKKYIEAIKKLK
jgi:hypothetical protein